MGKLPQAGQAKGWLAQKAVDTINPDLGLDLTNSFGGDTYDLILKAAGPWATADDPETQVELETALALPQLLSVKASGLVAGPEKDPDFFLKKAAEIQEDPAGFISTLGFQRLNLKLEDRGLVMNTLLVPAMIKMIKDSNDNPAQYPRYSTPVFVLMSFALLV